MSMGRSTRRSGMMFLLIGILGGLFFWVTDPKYGPEVHNDREVVGQLDWRHWLYVVRGSPENQVDAANQNMFSTVVGMAGSGALLVTGLWLMTRRSRVVR